MKTWTRVAATAAVAATALVGAASASSAISRVTCDASSVQVTSNQTTCWKYSGGQYVTLYSVSSVTSGVYSGYVYATTGKYTYFTAPTCVQVTGGSTISFIEIY